MSIPNWTDILPGNNSINSMSVEQLKALEQASSCYVGSLAHGVSGIGNLLACAALNSDQGLDEQAVVNVGWMLQGLGALISNLSDTNAAASYRLSEIQPGK